jgi:hypothetical protein
MLTQSSLVSVQRGLSEIVTRCNKLIKVSVIRTGPSFITCGGPARNGTRTIKSRTGGQHATVTKARRFGIILLLPKTHFYLSNADLSEAQTAPERQISRSVAHWNLDSTGLTVSAEGKQARSSTCAAKPGHDSSNTVAVHAMDKTPKGS